MEAVWTVVKNAVKEKIPDHCYRMWIEPVEYGDETEDGLILSVPNQFYRKRILTNYVGLLETEFSQVTGKDCKLSIGISHKKGDPEIQLGVQHRQLPLPNMKGEHYRGRVLCRNFTFDHFVVGENNGFAYSAALSLASKKSASQNSLFLLSKTGNGKSHLSQAIGHHILKEFPTERVFYITAEDFANEMVASFQNNSIGQFKQKYQNQCDVLLLEDVHYLTGKNRTQLELAWVLDSLFDSDKKIIFSSCYLPGEIPKLNDKLRSRLTCGLISNIDPPDYKTRIKILKMKSILSDQILPEEILQYLAGELSDNVRQLESGLIGVTAKSSLLGVPIDLDLAQSVVSNIVQQHRNITIDVIKKVVCKYYNVSMKELVSRSRKQRVVRPRQVAIFLSRKYTDQPLQAIGKMFNRYHATALYAIGTIERGLKTDVPLRQHIKFLSQKLESGDF
jgi:chromosomal replication initiator protein